MLNSSISTKGSAIDGFRVKIVSICILGFVFSLRTTFVGVLLAPTVFRVV